MISSAYRRQRLFTFLSNGGGQDLSSGYHIKQILIALGSGGFLGVGFGQSRQKFQYLPEVFADSIFAIIGEELGFVGTTFLVLLFAALIYKGYRIALASTDMFSRLLAVGITTWLALQFFVNVGAMTKIIPLTGIPLPLISYGGSSLVFMLIGLGLLANVSRSIGKTNRPT
jgi:cell division protein FtsW